MASDIDLQYYRRRAEEEQKRAETANDICVTRTHQALQRAYERKLRSLVAQATVQGRTISHP